MKAKGEGALHVTLAIPVISGRVNEVPVEPHVAQPGTRVDCYKKTVTMLPRHTQLRRVPTTNYKTGAGKDAHTDLNQQYS